MNDNSDVNEKPPLKETNKKLDESPKKPISEHVNQSANGSTPTIGTGTGTAAEVAPTSVRPLPLTARPVENGSSNMKQNNASMASGKSVSSAKMAKPAKLARPVNTEILESEEQKQ
jgi:hypothetical protein